MAIAFLILLISFLLKLWSLLFNKFYFFWKCLHYFGLFFSENHNTVSLETLTIWPWYSEPMISLRKRTSFVLILQTKSQPLLIHYSYFYLKAMSLIFSFTMSIFHEATNFFDPLWAWYLQIQKLRIAQGWSQTLPLVRGNGFFV